VTEVPYAWVLVLVSAAFVFGTVVNAIRFVNSGRPAHVIGMALNAVLAVITGWVAWVAVTGPQLP
jgi:hypothetical protein